MAESSNSIESKRKDLIHAVENTLTEKGISGSTSIFEKCLIFYAFLIEKIVIGVFAFYSLVKVLPFVNSILFRLKIWEIKLMHLQ